LDGKALGLADAPFPPGGGAVDTTKFK